MNESGKEKKRFHFKGERTRSTLIIVGVLFVYVLTIHLNIRIVFTLLTAFVSAAGVYEMIHAVGGKSKLLYTLSCGYAAVYPFLISYRIAVPHASVWLSFYALLLLCLAVTHSSKVKYMDCVMALFASVGVSYALSCFIRLNDLQYMNPRFTHLEGLFLFWIAFICSWVTDSFAFLVGRKFGKHKMTPHISPKKSWEGAIGGVVITAAINVLVLLGYSLVAKAMGQPDFWMASPLKYLYIVPISMLLSVVSIFGDLAASVLKRNLGIKDYSNLLPGHGGIMDRFDSCVFVLPVLYGIFNLIYG